MENKNIIYGINPAKEYLKTAQKCNVYLITGKLNPRQCEIELLSKEMGFNIIYLDKKDFINKFGDIDHQGVIIESDNISNFVMSESDFYKETSQITSTDTVLVLDGIKDVGNLGAILRSALLFGVKYVVLPKNNAASVNEFVIKRSAGAALLLRVIYVTNISRTLDELKKNGYWVYGADMIGEDIKSVSYAEKTVIVMGDEGEGIRRLVKENCDIMIKINTNQKLDSLNVSVSAGIILSDRYSKIK